MNLLLLASIVLIFVPSGIVCKRQKPTPPQTPPTPPQTPPTPPPTPQTPPQTPPTPPQTPPSSCPSNPLGLLASLSGTWVGDGFVLISLPDFDSDTPSTGPKSFRLLLNNTKETLSFSPLGGIVPNRGSLTDFGSKVGQPDIELSGLTYMQRVSDAVTNEALHRETGMWINVPKTQIPSQNATVVRMSVIPHGNSLMAQSTFLLSVPGGPLIRAVNSTPISTSGLTLGAAYLSPFQSPPGGFDPEIVNNPNLVLSNAIANQNIINTVVIVISTNPTGGILNIPFLIQNADTMSLDAIFWIETVQNEDGSTFQQLQYTQTIILNFLGIDWPHITVATLVQQ